MNKKLLLNITLITTLAATNLQCTFQTLLSSATRTVKDQITSLTPEQKRAIYWGIFSAVAAELVADNSTYNDDNNSTVNNVTNVALIVLNPNPRKWHQFVANTATGVALTGITFFKPDMFKFKLRFH